MFERLPKRTKGALAGKSDRRARGWGIFYEEGWDALKIAWLVFLVVFYGSFLFGVSGLYCGKTFKVLLESRRG